MSALQAELLVQPDSAHSLRQVQKPVLGQAGAFEGACKVNEMDRRWIDALSRYVGNGILPFYMDDLGVVDADATVDRFCEMHGIAAVPEQRPR